jgi:hypothetical protein
MGDSGAPLVTQNAFGVPAASVYTGWGAPASSPAKSAFGFSAGAAFGTVSGMPLTSASNAFASNAFARLAAAPQIPAGDAAAPCEPDASTRPERAGPQAARSPVASMWVNPQLLGQTQTANKGVSPTERDAAGLTVFKQLPLRALGSRPASPGPRESPSPAKPQDDDSDVLKSLERARREREHRDNEQQGSTAVQLEQQRLARLQPVDPENRKAVRSREEILDFLATADSAGLTTPDVGTGTPLFDAEVAEEDWEALVRASR